MKKFLSFPGGLVLGLLLGLASSASAAVLISFTDEDGFESWYRDSVYDLAEAEVITGYPDGSFGPGNNVNRAELAVILDRYEDGILKEAIEDEVTEVVKAIYELEDDSIDYTFSSFKAYVAMAESGILEAEEDLGAWTLDEEDLTIIDTELPTGYTIYEQETGSEESTYFLYYNGSRCEGDTCEDVEEWYRF